MITYYSQIILYALIIVSYIDIQRNMDLICILLLLLCKINISDIDVLYIQVKYHRVTNF